MAGGRGGKRNGAPGQAYPNRSDLSGAPQISRPTVATGQPYGQASAQQAALRQVPLAGNPPAQSGASPSMAGQSTGPPAVLPGQLGPLHGATQRPNEPLTAGLPTGPGPGPEALNLPSQQQPADGTDQLASTLRGLYQAFPTKDLARLIAQLGAQ